MKVIALQPRGERLKDAVVNASAKRTRKAANRWHASELAKCGQCGTRILPHTACPSCGYYKGRQVLTVEGK